jgi:hypothetical protein
VQIIGDCNLLIGIFFEQLKTLYDEDGRWVFVSKEVKKCGFAQQVK